MKVLVTGGAGYIGSTVCSALEDAGHVPVVLDSVVTGRREFVRGRAFYEGDVADRSLLDRIVDEHDLYAVVHCAARIVVPESVAQPGMYYRENVTKSLELFIALAVIRRAITDSYATSVRSPCSTTRTTPRVLPDTPRAPLSLLSAATPAPASSRCAPRPGAGTPGDELGGVLATGSVGTTHTSTWEPAPTPYGSSASGTVTVT